MTRTGTTLALLCLLLVGCTPRLTVELASDQESLSAPRFDVSERKRSAPRYDTLSVHDQQNNTVWHVRADPFDLSEQPSRVVYGETPAGFAVLTEPQALEPGGVYRLVVQGKGVGTLSFEATATGIVPSTD